MALLTAEDILDTQVLGRGLKAPIELDETTGNFATVEGDENLLQCIRDLLMTAVGERVMNEDFGTIVPRITFSNIEGVLDILPLRITEALQRYEPRIAKVHVKARKDGQSRVVCDISYVIKSTNTRSNQVVSYDVEGQ